MQFVAQSQVLDCRQEADDAALARAEDVFGSGNRNDVGLLAQIRAHQGDLLEQILKAGEGAVGTVGRAAESVCSGRGRPAAVSHRFVRPLVGVAAEVRGKVIHVVGEHHRMLVHINQSDGVHQPLETRLLPAVERHHHRGHASDLLGHL